MSFSSLLGRVSGYTEYDFRHDVSAPKILVVGVGGAGCNSVWRMKRLGLNVPTIAINTDMSHLQMIDADKKVHLKTRSGIGTGGRVQEGEDSALRARDKIEALLSGVDIVFVTTGLGGGTGTGAAPVIVDLAKKTGAMVISIVTLPFKVEMSMLMRAKEGLKKMMAKSNTVIVLENEKLLDIVPNRTLEEAFMVMDQLISYTILTFVDIITTPSMINIDISDLKYILEKGNLSTILISEGDTNNIRRIVTDALNNPLMNIDYSTANGALIHITVGEDATLSTIYSTVDTISSFLRENPKITMGARVDPEYNERMRILVVLTGVKVPFLEDENIKREGVIEYEEKFMVK